MVTYGRDAADPAGVRRAPLPGTLDKGGVRNRDSSSGRQHARAHRRLHTARQTRQSGHTYYYTRIKVPSRPLRRPKAP